ncbi:hypothetical protein A2U01_0105026, partial [Trifolium medium]|nr:hypothetical protein [Trifolium medium]
MAQRLLCRAARGAADPVRGAVDLNYIRKSQFLKQ